MSNAALLSRVAILVACLAAGRVTISRADEPPSFPASIDLSADVLGSRKIDLRWTHTPLSFRLDDLPGKRFERASPAYRGTVSAMAEYPPDAPRSLLVASCSASDGQFLYAEGPAGENIIVWCTNGSWFFGLTYPSGRLVRSPDGQTGWHYAPWSQGTLTGPIFALKSGALLIQTRNPASTLYRSEDNGATAALVLQAGPDGYSDGRNAWMRAWSLVEAPHGTIIGAEYGDPLMANSGRRVFRSVDDGRTWSVVFDQGTLYKHHHAVGYHRGTGRWVIGCGDGVFERRYIYSAADGQAGTWQDLTPPHYTQTIATWLLDVGDPTRFLAGGDTRDQVTLLDVSRSDGVESFTHAITNWDARSGKNLSFLLFEHDGVYYACNYDGGSPLRNAVISVSADLVHWAVYHRFTANERGATIFAGYGGGKLHLGVEDFTGVERHFTISPARLALREAVMVSPPTVNSFASANASSFETNLQGWAWHSALTGERTSAEHHHGSWCLKITGRLPADRGSVWVTSPLVPAGPSQRWQGRLWLKGGKASVVAAMRSSTLIGPTNGCAVDDQWREFVLEPINTGMSDTAVGIELFLGDDDTIDGPPMTLYVDAVQIEPVFGTPWQLGGVPRAAETLEYPVSSPPCEWTSIFTVRPDSRADTLSWAGPLYLKTYWFDADNYAELYYDASERCFKLAEVVAGAPAALVVSAEQFFQREAQIRIAVVRFADRWDLRISNGQPLQRATRAAAACPVAPTLVVRYGDRDGSRAFPAQVFDDCFYRWALSNDELTAAIDAPDQPSLWAVDGYRVERKTPGSAFVEIAAVPGATARFRDATCLPDTPHTYRVRATRAAAFSDYSNEQTRSTWKLGDLDGDGDADGEDYGRFAACFNGGGNLVADPCQGVDLDVDGDVDGADFSVFSACFNGTANPPACR